MLIGNGIIIISHKQNYVNFIYNALNKYDIDYSKICKWDYNCNDNKNHGLWFDDFYNNVMPSAFIIIIC